jgi:2-oxoglutarate ferredoxin oxidoreductase subunit alpha
VLRRRTGGWGALRLRLPDHALDRVVERFASRIPTVGGVFMQMEDELPPPIALIGAAWAGAKSFTVTSGPGFSLMMEHIGYAVMTETPCVFINVQRGGPSTVCRPFPRSPI